MRRTTAIHVLFAVLAIAFFAAPLAARLVGVTAESFENRRLAQPPKLSQGWEGFQQASRYLTDRMPLRAQAIRLNTRIWTDVFGTDPLYERDEALSADRALPFAGVRAEDRGAKGRESGLQGPVTASTGQRGWLFNGSETDVACAQKVPSDAILRRWASLVKATRETGRSSVMFAVPEKSSVYPEYLPESDPHKDCALEKKDERWSYLSEYGPDLGVFELRSELVRLKKRLGDQLFEVKDTHWTTLGSLTLVAAALDAVGDGIQIEDGEVVNRGRVSYTGDLDVASGRDGTAETFEYDIVRDRDAPRVPGRTVLVGDSFAYRKIHVFEPYFAHIESVSLVQPLPEVIDAIRRADHVIYEAVETNLAEKADDDPSLVTAIRDALIDGKQ